MSLLDRKVFREIRGQSTRSIMIISIVAITLGLLTGMRAAYPMLMATYETNLVDTNMADGRFYFDQPFSASIVTDLAANQTFLDDQQIDRMEGRLFYYTSLFYDNKEYSAVVIGLHFPNRVNMVTITDANDEINTSSNFLNGNHYCILEPRFAGSGLGQDVSLGSSLNVSFGANFQNYEVQAIGSDADYLYAVDPTSGMTNLGKMAIIWVDLETLQDDLLGGLPLVNQLLFTVDDRLNKEMTLDASVAIASYLSDLGIEYTQFTIFEETQDRQFFDADAGSVDKMGTIFGLIGLIGCSVVIFNTISRLVQSQKRNIGLFMSMGSPRSKIIFHYMKMTSILAFIGILIGIPLGYGMSVGMTQMVVRMYALHELVFPVAYREFIVGSLTTFIVCVALSGLSALPITRVTPREAMSAFYNRIRVSSQNFFEKMFAWIPGFRSIHMIVPIREIFLRKKKTAVTILAITTSMIILISSVAMVANMYGAVVDNYEKYNTADVEVVLTQPVPISTVSAFFRNESIPEGVNHEVYLSLPTPLVYNDKIQSYMELRCYQENSTLRTFNIIDGNIHSKADITKHGLIIGQSLAGKYEIQVGDMIEIGNLDNLSLSVDGLVGELIDYGAFWTLEAYKDSNATEYFGVPTDFINGIMLAIPSDFDKEAFREAMEAHFQVALWIDADQAKESTLSLMETMMGLLLLFVGVGMGIGVIFSFNTMYMGFVSRENDFLAFKAMGIENRYLRRMIFWENAIVSIFSLILTVPVGYLAYAWSMDYMLGDRFYMPISIPLYTWPLVFLLSLFSIALATQRMMHKIKKLVLADELRQRVVS